MGQYSHLVCKGCHYNLIARAVFFSLHLSTHSCSRLFMWFLVSWSDRDPRVSLCGILRDGFASVQQGNWRRGYPLLMRLHCVESSVPFAAERRASLICSRCSHRSRTFRCEDNLNDSFDWNKTRWLTSSISCTGGVVFIPVRPQNRLKLKETRTTTRSGSTRVDENDRRFSNDLCNRYLTNEPNSVKAKEDDR